MSPASIALPFAFPIGVATWGCQERAMRLCTLLYYLSKCAVPLWLCACLCIADGDSEESLYVCARGSAASHVSTAYV